MLKANQTAQRIMPVKSRVPIRKTTPWKLAESIKVIGMARQESGQSSVDPSLTYSPPRRKADVSFFWPQGLNNS
jgi:hypothetical protein